MNKFKVGDTVVAIRDGLVSTLRAGQTFKVVSLHGELIRLNHSAKLFNPDYFEVAQLSCSGILAPEEVAKALLQGKALEYYHDGAWHKVRNPRSVAINFIESSTFRYAAETMYYYGTKLPKPSTKPLDTEDKLYWVDMRVSKVKQSHYNREGVLYWDTPEQAQEALTAILKPFGIIPQPLDERLLQEQPR